MTRRGWASSVTLAAALALAAPTGAAACSTAYRWQPPPPVDPRAMLDGAQVVAEATVTDHEPRSGPTGDPADDVVRFTLTADRVLRGAVPDPYVYDQPVQPRPCATAPTLAVGDRVGWVDGAPVRLAALRAALAPYPPARGTGRAAVLVAGRFGDASLAALDHGGAVVAYGFGGPPELLARCPGGDRVVQAGPGHLAIRRVRDLRLLHQYRLPGEPATVRCLDSRGGAAVMFAGTRGGVATVRGRVLHRISRLTVTLGALGDRGALVADRNGLLSALRYDGRARPAGRLPAGTIALAATSGLNRTLVLRLRNGRAVLDWRDRRTRARRTRVLPYRSGEGLPRLPESLAFDHRGRPLIGFGDRLRRFDTRFRRERLLAGGERHAALGGSGAWAVDFGGRLWRGRRLAARLPRLDAGPMVALDAAAVVATARVPSVLD